MVCEIKFSFFSVICWFSILLCFFIREKMFLYLAASSIILFCVFPVKEEFKILSVNKGFEIKFDKGPARKVPSRLASLVLQKFNKLKPADKLKFQKQAEKSYSDFLRAVKDMTK